MSTKKRKPVVKKPAPAPVKDTRVERAMVALVDCLEGKGTLHGAQLRNIKSILTEAVENEDG